MQRQNQESSRTVVPTRDGARKVRGAVLSCFTATATAIAPIMFRTDLTGGGREAIARRVTHVLRISVKTSPKWSTVAWRTQTL